ncbi:MAG: hypothetical protein IJR14_09995 [Synergistaceae bacterium]|nr:hypothetical protein [Synergistaceae bacterium]
MDIHDALLSRDIDRDGDAGGLGRIGGDTVNVGPGTCALRNALDLKAEVELIGAGASVTILDGGAQIATDAFSTSDATVYARWRHGGSDAPVEPPDAASRYLGRDAFQRRGKGGPTYPPRRRATDRARL